MFWEDVRAASDDGANRLFLAGDSISSVPKYLKKLAEAKPDNLDDVGFFAYTSATETTPQLVDDYRKLGVYRAHIGLDSGDDAMLRRIKGPHDSVEQNLRAVRLLTDAGIRVYASFVLGGPGETAASLNNTFDFVRHLVSEGMVEGCEANPLFPEMNAPFGRLLLNPKEAIAYSKNEGFNIRNNQLLFEMPEKWISHECPDPKSISVDWAEIFAVPYDNLLEVSSSIKRCSRDHGIPSGSSWTEVELL
jgi:hypothetical protein